MKLRLMNSISCMTFNDIHDDNFDILNSRVKGLNDGFESMKLVYNKEMLMGPKDKVSDSSVVTFSAYATVDRSYAPGSTLLFDGVITNVGGAYNTDTSEFLCPVRGYYLVSASLLSYEDNSVWADIVVGVM